MMPCARPRCKFFCLAGPATLRENQARPDGEEEMTDSPEKALSPEERQATVDRLCAHFARDAMNTTELERRLDIAYAARTKAELDAQELDIPSLRSETHPAGPATVATASV
ncbi:MAG: DUF1707 domain-containing protein, partial [Gemmatimonadales bacterium]|nr:DUF1707 domain-containing protein [Gemmatimonadales bacterium]